MTQKTKLKQVEESPLSVEEEKPLSKQETVDHIRNVDIPKLQGAKLETETQLSDLKQGLKELDANLKNQVDDVWEGLPDSTAKGSIDKLLKLSTPKRGQLLENIIKLEFSISSLADKIYQKEKEATRIEEEIQKHYLESEIKTVYKLKDAFIKQVQGCEKALEDVKDSIKRCWALNPDYLQTLNKNYTPENIRPDRWTLNFLEAFKPGNLQDLSTLILVERISHWGNVHGPNPFALQGQQMPETELIRSETGDKFASERPFI